VTLTVKCNERLDAINPVLARVVRRAAVLSKVEFRVIEGMRTAARQLQLFNAGASKTMNSRHLTGHAVDLAPIVEGKIRWDWPLFYPMADAMKAAASELKVPLVWGGDWKTFKDGPHFELDRSKYP